MIKLRSHTTCLVGMTLQRAKVLAVSSGWGGGGAQERVRTAAALRDCARRLCETGSPVIAATSQRSRGQRTATCEQPSSARAPGLVPQR